MTKCPAGNREGGLDRDYRRCKIAMDMKGCPTCGVKGNSPIKCESNWNVCPDCYPKGCVVKSTNTIDLDDIMLSKGIQELIDSVGDVPVEKNTRTIEPGDIKVPEDDFWCPHCGFADGYTSRSTVYYYVYRNRQGEIEDTEHGDDDEWECDVCSECERKVRTVSALTNAMKREFLNDIITIANERGWMSKWNNQDWDNEILRRKRDYHD